MEREVFCLCVLSKLKVGRGYGVTYGVGFGIGILEEEGRGEDLLFGTHGGSPSYRH